MNDSNSIADKLLKTAGYKQDVCEHTHKVFDRFKCKLKEIVVELEAEIKGKDDRIRLKFEDRGSHDARIWVGGDVLIFHMHTNVFQFSPQDTIWQSSYLKSNPQLGYCGIINVYNFLADSLQYNRVNDAGYMIARILVNIEDHFLVHAKKIFGFDYQNFINNQLDDETVKSLIKQIIAQAIGFEMYVPPFDQVQLVRVHEMRKLSSSLQLKTGKRLGFKFQADDDFSNI